MKRFTSQNVVWIVKKNIFFVQNLSASGTHAVNTQDAKHLWETIEFITFPRYYKIIVNKEWGSRINLAL